jgi:hypothetical protein
MAAPPAGQDVVVAGCESASEGGGCPWKIFSQSLRRAIDHRFVSIEPAHSAAKATKKS